MPNHSLQRTRHERPAMNPTGWILILFAACVAWIPAAVYLGKLAAQHQDAAGRGIYSLLTTMFLLVVGGLSFGIPALFQARRHRQQVHVCMRVAAWLILLSPVLVAGSVILSELYWRHVPMRSMMPSQSAAANRRPAGQSDGSDNLAAMVAADRAFPAAIAELGR
jgi:hypothetical protein